MQPPSAQLPWFVVAGVTPMVAVSNGIITRVCMPCTHRYRGIHCISAAKPRKLQSRWVRSVALHATCDVSAPYQSSFARARTGQYPS